MRLRPLKCAERAKPEGDGARCDARPRLLMDDWSEYVAGKSL